MHNSVSSEVGNHFSQQSKGQLLGCPQHSPICKATKELGHKWGGGGREEKPFCFNPMTGSTWKQ